MGNPYPADFADESGDVRLAGSITFTDGGNQPGGSVEVTDGSTTVTAVTEIDFTSGATVTDAGGGVAQVAVSGGSQPDFAAMTLAADLTPYSGSAIPFDTTLTDAGGYWDSGANSFVVPTGKGGMFQVGASIPIGKISDPISFPLGEFDNLGSYPNVQFALVTNTADASVWAGSGSALLGLSDGEAVSVQIIEAVAIKVFGGANGSYFWLQRLGDVPS